LGRFNTAEEVDFTIGRVAEEVKRLREISPLYKAGKARAQRRSQANGKAREEAL
jgi:hypothetical protein